MLDFKEELLYDGGKKCPNCGGHMRLRVNNFLNGEYILLDKSKQRYYCTKCPLAISKTGDE